MKEHFQDYGVRKWAGDDLIDLQRESLDALQGLVEPYAPCIIKGCNIGFVSTTEGFKYRVGAGLVALKGVDIDGQECAKIVRVDEFISPVLPVYLSLTCEQESRAYADGGSKPIVNNYIAKYSTEPSDDALEIQLCGTKTLVNTLGISEKLKRDGGEAKDTVVGFTEATTRSELKTGSKLGILIGQAKKWFSDLRSLAFKDKVAKSDLADELATELNNKVEKVAGKGLSTNDFTDALKDKVNSHSHSWSSITNKPSTFTPSDHAHGELTGFSDTRNVTEKPNDYNGGFYVKGIKTYTACGLTKAQAGGNHVHVFGYRGWDDSSGGYAHEFALTDNGLILHRYGSTTSWSSWTVLAHTSNLTWGSIYGKPSTFSPSEHAHTLASLHAACVQASGTMSEAGVLSLKVGACGDAYRSSTGVYKINSLNGSVAGQVLVVPISTSEYSVSVSKSGGNVTIYIRNASGALANCGFYFMYLTWSEFL